MPPCPAYNTHIASNTTLHGADGFYSDSNEVNLYGLWDVSQAKWSTRLLELT